MKPRTKILLGLLVALSLVLSLVGARFPSTYSLGRKPSQSRIPQRASSVEIFKPQVVIDRPFPAIKRFPLANADQARQVLQDKDLVLGVSIGNQARAYPINMLCGPTREIINDRLGDHDIAATW